jgi:hypothetical protein
MVYFWTFDFPSKTPKAECVQELVNLIDRWPDTGGLLFQIPQFGVFCFLFGRGCRYLLLKRADGSVYAFLVALIFSKLHCDFAMSEKCPHVRDELRLSGCQIFHYRIVVADQAIRLLNQVFHLLENVFKRFQRDGLTRLSGFLFQPLPVRLESGIEDLFFCFQRVGFKKAGRRSHHRIDCLADTFSCQQVPVS